MVHAGANEESFAGRSRGRRHCGFKFCDGGRRCGARIYKAAPALVALPVNWTGFYVGAHLGGAWGTKDLTDPFLGKSLVNASVNGFLGSGQIGYNYQMG